MSDPLVSVIIPCYNAEQWIGEAVRSATSQTYDSVEVIVVDDGSEDRSREVVRSIRDKSSSCVRLVEQSNTGASAARNRGVKEASGDRYLFLDGDDRLVPVSVESHIKAMEESGANVTVSDWVNHYEGKEEWVRVSASFRFPSDPLASLIYSPMHTSAVMVPATSVVWNEDLVVNEVFDYFFSVFKRGYEITYTGEVGSIVRHGHSDSRITALHDHWEPHGRIRMLARYKTELRDAGKLTELREAVLDEKQLSWLYEAVRRYGHISDVEEVIQINRSRLPIYYWFNLAGVPLFAYLFGPVLGTYLCYSLNRLIGRA